MDEGNYMLYNGGDISKGLNGAATKVLMAVNKLDGTTYENLLAAYTGLSARFVHDILWSLAEEGLLPENEAVYRAGRKDG